MNNIIELPMMMSAKDLQAMGFGRGMAYRLLRGDIVPVVTIGKRRFIRQTTLLDWLDEQERSYCKKAEISAEAISQKGNEPNNNNRRETLLFSETDLLRMGLNCHDAKYLLNDYGTEAYQLGTQCQSLKLQRVTGGQ